MKTISLRIPDSLDSRLEALARRSGQSKSDVVRAALEEHLKNGTRKRTMSAYDLVADLVGCIDEGPEDLASNKKYMEGYGE